MKKIWLILGLILVLAMPAFGADVAQYLNGWQKQGTGGMVTGTFTVTADISGNVAAFSFLKPGDIEGGFCFTVEAYSSTDAGFTVVISTAGGSPLFSQAWTTATTGEALKSFTDRWPVYNTPTIDVTGLTASEVCTVIITILAPM